MGSLANVELSRRAEKDLRGLGHVQRLRVRRALEAIAAGAPNLDIKPLAGTPPWLLVRAGDVRIILRLLAGAKGDRYLVARIVDRKDLISIVRRLR